MRILLDENLPPALKPLLIGHEAKTVAEMGWTQTKNGALLALMKDQFDVFITGDRNMQYQQQMTEIPIIFVVLIAVTNKISDLSPTIPILLPMLEKLQPGTVTEVSAKQL